MFVKGAQLAKAGVKTEIPKPPAQCSSFKRSKLRGPTYLPYRRLPALLETGTARRALANVVTSITTTHRFLAASPGCG